MRSNVLVAIFELVKSIRITHLIVVPEARVLVARSKYHFALTSPATIQELTLIYVSRLILQESNGEHWVRL